MFEGVVASLLNRYMGKYIEDLDPETLNIGIFSGSVTLTNLKVKAEALYELGLPISVKKGIIGKVSLNIPWSRLCSQTSVISLEDIFILAGPVTCGRYDPEIEKKLLRAEKKRIIEQLDPSSSFLSSESPENFAETLIASILNNLKIFIRNVHIRYKDSFTNNSLPVSVGLCLHNFSIENTNSNWKPISHSSKMGSIYQVAKIKSLSIYCNANCSEMLLRNENETGNGDDWIHSLQHSLETFKFNKKESLDFVVKPMSARLKIIINKSNECRIPKLLIDFVLEDVAVQLSHKQYLALLVLFKSFHRISINRLYRKFHPEVPVSQAPKKWWKYAYNSVVHDKIMPFTWSRLMSHRKNYRAYCEVYKKILLDLSSAEDRMDLQKIEDTLDIYNIVLAREETKMKIHSEVPEKIVLKECSSRKWLLFENKSCPIKRPKLFVNDCKNGFLSQLSQTEKNCLYEMIGFLETHSSFSDKPKQYIKNKFNFTIANFSLSLSSGGSEVLVVTMSDILTSIETHPAANSYKISASIESVVVEGASVEFSLIPIISSDNISKGNQNNCFLMFDFEKNPMSSEVDYLLSISCDSLEIIYHEFSYSTLASFLHSPTLSMESAATFFVGDLHNTVQHLITDSISRHRTFQINIDLKLPHVIIPENGSIQNHENVIVIDLGHLKILSDLQLMNSNLEDATKLELEEKLYDRINFTLSDFQILIFTSGQDWKNYAKPCNSSYHMISKIHLHVVFSNSIKPDYKQLPRYKLNISLQKLRINMSDNRIITLMNFLDNLPIPRSHTILDNTDDLLMFDHIKLHNDLPCLETLQFFIAQADTKRLSTAIFSNLEETNKIYLNVDRSNVSSEISDEDSELWAKGLDLPGFDDNVSQNNVILYLFRINIAQIILELRRSANLVDKSYLVVKATNFCSDIAFMEYGPAMQISLGSINVVDKLHSSMSSVPLQLFNSEEKHDFVTILYRKVRSDCPDFKSHFHNVEQSLVIGINPFQIVYHRDAIINLSRYLRYFHDKFRGHYVARIKSLALKYSRQIYKSWFKSNDPPIPPGATKFSYSACISCVTFNLCDTELDFLLIKISGFEIDFLFKANERLILRMFLATLSIDDISNTSLYPKVLTVEDGKLIEMKYDRRTPRAGKTNLELNQNDLKSDGQFKFHLGRVNVVLLYKLIVDTEKFFSPFISKHLISRGFRLIGKKISRFFGYLRFFSDKILVSIDCQLPTLLIPQHASSPNLLIFNTGDLTAENFFKEIHKEEYHTYKTSPVMDDTLIKMDAIFVSRGVVNLNGTIIVQETIMEPTCCKIDKKQILINDQISEDEALTTFDINMTLNKVNIHLGQKDLSTLNLIWRDNVRKTLTFLETDNGKKINFTRKEEADVRKLQAFFYQSESNRKDLVLRANFDGVELCLYRDIDEVLSSPVRDESRSLCKFKLGEIILQGQFYACSRSEIQISLQSFLLEDTRSIRDICIRRILQSYGASTKQSNNENVSVTVPPVISVTIGKNPAGESRCDVLVDHTRFNFGVSFLSELFKFIVESIPYEETLSTAPEGRINYGYVGESICIKIDEESDDTDGTEMDRELIENEDGMSLSVNCRRCEIMFFSELDDFSKSYALLLRSDLSFEYVRHPANKSFTCVISDLHMLSKLQSKIITTQSDVILQPCVLEISQNWAAIDGEKKLSLTCDEIDLHISASTIHTVLNIVQELNTNFVTEIQEEEDTSTPNYFSEQDLWSPKKITPYLFPQTCHQPCKNVASLEPVESMIISLPVMSLMFEIEDVIQKKPVMLLKTCAEMKLKNWSNSLEMKGDINVQCSYYNFEVNAWEPVIEPTFRTENKYRPWEISIKAFKAKAYPIHTVLRSGNKVNDSKKNSTASPMKSKKDHFDPEISADENDDKKTNERRKMNNNLIDQLDYLDTDSESENEDTVIEKLRTKFSQLLTGESSDENSHSDSEDSLCEQTPSENSDEGSDLDTMSFMTSNSFLPEKKTVFISKRRESLDSRLECENVEKLATYVVLSAEESFEVVVTPSTLSVIKQIIDSFSLKFNHILTDAQFLSLKNDVAPQSTATLQVKTPLGPPKILMSANYSLDDSSPSSRNSTAGTPCNLESLSDFEFNPGIESFEGEFAADAHSKIDSAKRKSDGEILRCALQFPQTSVDSVFHNIVDRQLHLNVNGFDELIVICPIRTANKFHVLQPFKNGIKYYIVVSVINDLWGQSVTVRSPLQLKNETCYALALYYKKAAFDNTDFELIGEATNPFDDSFKFAILEPDEMYNVPLMITYHCSIYLLPLSEDYHLSEIGLWWRELANNIMMPKDVICKPKNEKSPLFVVRAVTTEGVHFPAFVPTVPNFQIRLLPSVIIYNLLPCAFYLKIPSVDFNVRIEAGGKSSLYSVDLSVKHPVSIEVPLYFGVTWNGTFNLCHKLEDKLLLMKTDQDTDGGNKQLSLNVRADKSESCHVIIYSPYWIINKTGLPVQIKSSQPDAVYDTFAEEPLFFSFRRSQKRTIRMRVYQASWSSPASIDIAGCSALVLCRDRERNRSYHLLMEVSLSQLSPLSTKLVTLMPYFLLSNECRLPLRYMEENETADLWVDLPPNQTVPFWPETQSMKMYVKLKDSSLVSQHFYINEACQTVLRMDKGSALVVDIIGGHNKPFLITFRHYKEGDAPVRIDNFCEDLFLKISQGNLGQVTLLSPYQSLLYTWDDPTEEKKLQWNVYNRKNKGFTIQFDTDGYGQEFVNFKLIKPESRSPNSFLRNSKLSSSLKKLTSKYNAESSSSEEESEREDNNSMQGLKTREGKVMVYWVSYLENKQRVLLFSQDDELAYYAYSKIDSERSNLEMFLSLKGVGLSLVKKFKDTPRELAYFSLSDSSASWEVNIAHSWKILPLELATWLEHQRNQGIKKAQMRDYVNADLEKMHLIKPFFGELRRSYHPAIWMHYRKSLNYFYFQWKIHRVQVDNQLPSCAFPVVLYPKVLSYDVVRKFGLQPCLELTLLKKQNELLSTNVFKYVKFTALEFHLQLDKYFILSLFDLIQPCLRTESPSLRIRADICKVHHPLTIKFNQDYLKKRKTIFEYIYISPIKIQFSITMQNSQNLNSVVYDPAYLRACLYHFFNFMNAAYVDSKVVKISCSNLEEFGLLTYPPTKLSQLSHLYLQNLLQPIYANLLGMDTFCLPNAETDISDDYVELFYDLSLPFVKKLDEFAEAISEDARCLLSHVTSSSMTSHTSLIMCGKRTSLDLGLNPELTKKSSKFQSSFEELEHIFKGDQCFETGVVYGLSGVYINSSTGFKPEGTELFFRSVGKHLLRLVNKYSNTITNVRATAIDCIKRAAETGTDIIFRRRLPKYINPLGMRPYSIHHAIGLNILNSINKGIYSETDDFWTHIILDQQGRSCLLLTLQHIFFLKKHDLWDPWKTEWGVEVNNVTEVPKVVDHRLVFKIKQDETPSDFNNKDQFIEHEDEDLLFWLQKMVEIIFIVNLESKPCFFVESQELER